MSFGLGFEKGLGRGIPIGVQSFLSARKDRRSDEKLLAEQKQKLIEKDKQTTAQGNILDLDVDRDELTGELKVNYPEGYEYEGTTDAQKLQFLPDVGNEFQEAFKQIERDRQPKDFYVNKKEEMDAETKTGIITGIDTDRESPTFGNRIKIGDNPNYQFKSIDKTIFEGVIEVPDETGKIHKVGQKGKRSKLVQYEDGSFNVIQDIGDIKGKDGVVKPIESVLFESEIAELDVKKNAAINKRNIYIQKGVNKKGFGDDPQREAFREGINSQLIDVAWEYAKLSSPAGQNYIKDIFTEGQGVINQQAGGLPIIDRQTFYEAKLIEVRDEWKSNDWMEYPDFLSAVQFLDAMYKSYIKSEDPVKDEDELLFNLPPLQ